MGFNESEFVSQSVYEKSDPVTDYAKIENKEQKRCQPHASHDSSAFQAFK